MDIKYSQTKETLRRSRNDSTICSASISEDDPNSMLRGMKGYELTPSDLEFIEKMKQEKLIKKLEGDLAEAQKLLKSETTALNLALFSKEKVEAELKKFPSCEETIDLARLFLKMTLPLPEVMELEPKSLLARVKEEDVQRAIAEKRVALAQMETMVANKRQKELKEAGQQEKRILNKQLKIQGMMSQLSNLKSELAEVQETYEALEMKIEAAEIKVEMEAADTQEELQATKSQAHSPKTQGKKRKQADKMVETLQDTTNQSKPTKKKSKARKTDRTDNQTHLGEEPGNKNTHEALKTSKEQPKKKSGEVKQKSQGVRGRRNRQEPSETAATREETPSRVKTGEPTAQHPAATPTRRKETSVAENDGPRRSKRIASKRQLC